MTESLEQIALRLRRAYEGTPIQSLRHDIDPANADDAYKVQDINTRFWANSGRRIIGRKLGLTAKAVQAQFGVNVPDFGTLFDDMQIKDGGILPASKAIQPRAEAEVALVLGSPITSASVTPDDIAAATDHVRAAIEIVDSRIADWNITFADTVADNGSSAFFVLSSEKKPLDGLDLYTCGMAMEINDEIVSVGAGAACLGHPLKAAAWLARVMVTNGSPLRAGDILLTGALGPIAPLSLGDRVKATIGGLGSVSFSYGRGV